MTAEMRLSLLRTDPLRNQVLRRAQKHERTRSLLVANASPSNHPWCIP